MPIRSFRDLEIYQEALDQIEEIYTLVGGLPAREDKGLSDQMRRAAVSVAANIAEGYSKKRSVKEFQAYLQTAIGSCNEVGALLDVCERVGLLGREDWRRMTEACTRLAKRISALSRRWE